MCMPLLHGMGALYMSGDETVRADKVCAPMLASITCSEF